jgi:hypothetical protein
MPSSLSVSELAQILFASALQESDDPTPIQIRSTIEHRQLVDGNECGPHCVACVAQEAGDHPEFYLARMRWALRAVAGAYPSGVAA